MKMLALALMLIVPAAANAGGMEELQLECSLNFLKVAPGGEIPSRNDESESTLFSLAQSVSDMNHSRNQSLDVTLTGVESIGAIVSLMAANKRERVELAQDLMDFGTFIDGAAVKTQSLREILLKTSPAANSLGARALQNNVLQARATVESLRTHTAALESAVEAQGDKLSFKTVQLAKDLIAKVDTLASVLDSLADASNAAVR